MKKDMKELSYVGKDVFIGKRPPEVCPCICETVEI